MPDCDAILLAAGNSRRLGFDKILTPLAGQPAVCYSLRALEESSSVGTIILVTRKDLFEKFKELTRDLKTPVQIIEGGKERQDSVFNGLKQASAEYALIHDAARPLLTSEGIEELLKEAREHGSAVCSQRATDTIKQEAEEGVQTLDRSRIWLMQTPQIFQRETIFKAYEHVQKNKLPITDDASAVEAWGGNAHLVDAGVFNLKITRENDWKLIELWLGQGQGVSDSNRAIHKIRNQLSPLVGYLPLVEKYGGDHPKFQEYFAKLQAAALQIQENLKQ